nr:immunoglobulin heavy chain junction region [Macaca mulatta]
CARYEEGGPTFDFW